MYAILCTNRLPQFVNLACILIHATVLQNKLDEELGYNLPVALLLPVKAVMACERTRTGNGQVLIQVGQNEPVCCAMKARNVWFDFYEPSHNVYYVCNGVTNTHMWHALILQNLCSSFIVYQHSKVHYQRDVRVNCYDEADVAYGWLFSIVG